MTSHTLSQTTDERSSNGSNGRALPGVPAAALSTAELTAELQRRGLVVLDGARYWTHPLARVSGADLTNECHLRGLIVLDGQAPRELPGLLVHPGGRVLRWRGVTYTLPTSQGRLLLALCALWPRPISGTALTQAVWGPGYDRNNARVTVRGLRARCPGLIETVGYSGYRLALEASS